MTPDVYHGAELAGVGYSQLSRASSESVLSLAVDACRAAVQDAGVAPCDVDGIATFSWEGDSVPAVAVATAMRIPELRFVLDVTMGGQAPCWLVAEAAAAVAAGRAKAVLVYRALRGRSGQRVGSVRASGLGTAYRYPLGLVAYPQLIALWARRLLFEIGASPDDLAVVVQAQRAAAGNNDRALVTAPIDRAGYLCSPMVAEPFRVVDCAIEIDGACAVLVAHSDLIADESRPRVAVRAAGYSAGAGAGLDTGDPLGWPDWTRNFASPLAGRLYAEAGMAATDIAMAQIYDCFSSTVLFGLEGFGLADRGEAIDFIRDGHTALTGRLPVNTGGGMLCEGYLHGMNSVAEAIVQLRGNGVGRQVDAENCLVTSGALTDGSAMILEAKDTRR